MNKGKIYDVLLEDIIVNPHQPRQIFNDDSLIELAESIGQHGLLQPIVLRINDDEKYEIIAGERRYRAFELLGYDKIPAIIKDLNIKDSAILAMIENIQRDNLHFYEVAKGYKRLMEDFNLQQVDLISIVGKSQSSIANKMRILNLCDQTIDLVIKNKLTERHARALLKVKDEKKQVEITKEIIKNKLNVSDTEKFIKNYQEGKESKKKKQEKPIIKSYVKDIRLFTNTIKQAVDAINSTGVDAKYIVREETDKYTITIDIPIER